MSPATDISLEQAPPPAPAPAPAPVAAPAAPVPAAAPAAAPAPAAITLADAFKADPGGIRTRTDDGDERPPRGVEKPEPAPAPPSPADLDRLVAEREAERTRTAEVDARVRSHEDQAQQKRTAALARIGDDKEFASLSSRRLRGEVLTYEDDEKLTQMLASREWAADLWEMTDRAHKADIARRLGDRVGRYGLDRGTVYEASLPELVDHVAAATETRVRKETANEIAELKTQLRGHKTRAAAASVPTVGGASAPGGAGVPADGASPLDFFSAGIRSGANRSPAPAPSRARAGR